MRTMLHESRPTDARRGVVLIVVVGVLAILMLMAGTLALASRVGYKMSVSYGHAESLDIVLQGVESYCVDTLYQDKYGNYDGYPYSYEAGAANLVENDENYDWPGEEWLDYDTYTTGGWNSGAYGVRVDTDADGTWDEMAPWQPYNVNRAMPGGQYGSLNGISIAARMAIHFQDLGGRVDISSTGNWDRDQNQGLTPFEIALADVDVAGDMDRAADDLLTSRLGLNKRGDSFPARLPLGLDKNADGTVGGAGEEDFTEYSPIYAPAASDRPFAEWDRSELFLMPKLPSSRAGRIFDTHRIPQSDWRFFTAGSAVTAMAGRAPSAARRPPGCGACATSTRAAAAGSRPPAT